MAKILGHGVFDPLPLQQGLRPHFSPGLVMNVNVFDPLPLQQGLRLAQSVPLGSPKSTVFDPLPLQQGLRH